MADAVGSQKFPQMTHAELVARAARWLRNTERCTLVLTEYSSAYVTEKPDVIGWRANWDNGHIRCINVECKTSRADFLADLRKGHRMRGHTMGSRRWYFAPMGVLRADEMPANWGLAEVSGRSVLRTKEAPALDETVKRNFDGELNFLLSAAANTSAAWIRNMRETAEAPLFNQEIDA
jgi:hypothetical protein